MPRCRPTDDYRVRLSRRALTRDCRHYGCPWSASGPRGLCAAHDPAPTPEMRAQLDREIERDRPVGFVGRRRSSSSRRW